MLLSIYIYIFVPLVISIGLLPSFTYNKKRFSSDLLILSSLFIISLVLILRDVQSASDMVNYSWMYKETVEFDNIFKIYHGNLFFSFLMYLGNLFDLNNDIFFVILSILYLLFFYQGVKYIFQNKKYTLLALSLFSLTSTFVLLFVNVIRQGLSFSLLILTVGLIINGKKYLSYITSILAIFSHFAVIPIIILMFLAKFFIKRKTYQSFFLLILVLFLPLIGQITLDSFSSIGGIFHKIEAFSQKNYNNILVYIKAFFLYLILLLSFIYGKKYKLFEKKEFKFIYTLYLLIIYLVFFTLPVLLLSSRFLYYASGLIPILIVFIFYAQKNFINFKIRVLLLLLSSSLYGLFIYNFKSITNQLGI